MTFTTPDLCDQFPDEVQRTWHRCSTVTAVSASFGGEIVTVKCFEDNSLVKEQLGLPGHG